MARIKDDGVTVVAGVPAMYAAWIAAIDAPDDAFAHVRLCVSGAAALGLPVGAGLDGEADLSALRSAIDQGRVSVLYVVDPGPDGSMGR